MPTHVALLRGINVVGRNKVSMPELRLVVASLGHRDVTTYIQSRNVLFTPAKRATSDALADALEAAVARELGVSPSVVVVSREDLAGVVRANPYPQVENHRQLHALFRRDAPGKQGVASVAAAVERARAKGSRDQACVVGRTLYLWTPDGFARSALRAELDRGGPLRTPARDATARNWANGDDAPVPAWHLTPR